MTEKGGDGSRGAPDGFELGGERVEPGARMRVEIPIARLATGTWLHLPVEAVHGRRPGPVLWLSAAVHGDEVDGVEIIRQVLEGLEGRSLAGTVVAAPVVNVFGFVAEDRYLPDRRDLNRSFPGSKRGSMASRLANLFMEEVVGRSDYGIDFHCGSDDRDNLPQVRGDLDDEETLRLARAFGAPVTIHGKPPDGSLRRAAVKAGARVLLYEGGEARRFTPDAIEIGVRGVRRVLRALQMVPEDGAEEDDPDTLESRQTHWVRAGRSGICRLHVELGQRVAEGEELGTIADALGADAHPVVARKPGLVIGRRINPLVHQGEAVAHLAEVEP